MGEHELCYVLVYLATWVPSTSKRAPGLYNKVQIQHLICDTVQRTECQHTPY